MERKPTRFFHGVQWLILPAIMIAIEAAISEEIIGFLYGKGAFGEQWYVGALIYAFVFGVFGFPIGAVLWVSARNRFVMLMTIAPLIFFTFAGAMRGYAYGQSKGPDLRNTYIVVADSIYDAFAQVCCGAPIGAFIGLCALGLVLGINSGTVDAQPHAKVEHNETP